MPNMSYYFLVLLGTYIHQLVIAMDMCQWVVLIVEVFFLLCA